MHEKVFVRRLLKWFDTNKRVFTWRKTKSPYKILVAEILLQRTRADLVEDVYPAFIDKFPGFEELGNAGLSEIALIVDCLGLQNKRTKFLSGVGVFLTHHPDALENPDKLYEIRGIGDYTVNAIKSQALGIPAPMIDANSRRLLGRFFNISNNSDLKKKQGQLLSKNNHRDLNLAILDFGAFVCRNKPKCHLCPLSEYCFEYLMLNKTDWQYDKQ